MWPWSKIRELQRDLNTAKLLGGWAEEDRDWYKDRCQKLRDAQQPNPDAWRTVVIDEDLAKYYSPGKPGDSGKYAIYGSLEEHVRHILTRERFLTEERKFDAKVAASIERLADAKVVPASYPETIYHPAPGISQASLDALRKAGKDAKAKAPRRGRK
jgi:hypothetical protein